MVAIIQERKNPSFAERLNVGIGQGLQVGSQLYQNKKQDEAFQRLTGMDLSGLPPEAKQEAFKQFSKIQAQQQLLAQAFPERFGKSAQQETSEQVPERLQGRVREFQDFGRGENLFEEAETAAALGLKPLSDVFTKEAAAKSRESSENKKLAFSETKDYRDRLSNESRGASELEPVLDQLESLINKGKLTNPVISKLAEKTGLIGLLNPESQQFHALSIGFLKDAKNIFGSRVTNFDLQTYIDKIPRLVQTNKGKKAIIDNFRALGQASKIRNQIKNEIIKENKGIPPLDLEAQVEEKSAPKLDKIAEKFNKSFIESSRSPSGKIRVRNSNGTLGEVSEKDIQKALDKGYILE